MTTTTKTANGNPSTKGAPGKNGNGGGAAIGDGWDDVPRATGESDHAEWCPQLSELKEERQQHMLSLKPEGSHCTPSIVGKLVVAQAFGEPRYFVDTDERRMALPNHGVLTSSLDRYDLSKVAVVRIAFDGRASRSRQGEQAAFVYDVRAKGADGKGVAPGQTPRADALLPIHKANKAKRDAAKSKAPDFNEADAEG